jgi:uncharacterized ferritin-like protein (DUF455 family)
MTEIRTVTTLLAKRDEIERSIANYEARLEQARAESSHVNAVISIFEAVGDRDTTTAYILRGELVMICNAALAEHGLMNRRALVTHILEAKGLDGGDRVLAKSVAERLIHALRMQAKREKIAIAGKERGAIVWGI